MTAAGLDDIHVTARMVYVDSSRPDLVDGFTNKTFIAMVEGVRDAAVGSGLMAPEVFDEGIAALMRTTVDDGVFCYTFFKAVGRTSET